MRDVELNPGFCRWYWDRDTVDLHSIRGGQGALSTNHGGQSLLFRAPIPLGEQRTA